MLGIYINREWKLVKNFRNGREFPSLEKGSSLKLFQTAKIVRYGWWKKPNISISNVEIVFHHPDSLVRRHPIWLTLFSINSYNSAMCSKHCTGTYTCLIFQRQMTCKWYLVYIRACVPGSNPCVMATCIRTVMERF